MSFNKGKYQGYSDALKKKFDIRKVVNIRIRVFMAVVVLLAGILIYKTYDIMFVQADHFNALLVQYTAKTIKRNSMSGEFLDRNGDILVGNKAVNVITYTNEGDKIDTSEIAQKFVEYFDVEENINEYDMKLLWMELNPDIELLSEAELETFIEEEADDKTILNAKMEKITNEMLATITSKEKQAFIVKVIMDSTKIGETSTIVLDVTTEQIAYLNEHANVFTGFTHDTTWAREYNPLVHLNAIIGSISDIIFEKQGYYLESGYALNDKIGSYGLEYQYEDLIRGQKTEYVLNQNGVLEEVVQGRKGYDIKTTIDIGMQSFVENLLENQLKKHENDSRRYTNEELVMVVSDPNTGDILGMADIKRDEDGTYYNDAQGIFLSAFTPGSIVKPATVYMGLDTEVIKPGEVIVDAPMYIKGTPVRHSWKNLGALSDIQALQYSSNIYMFNIALRLAGASYVPNGPLNIADAEGTLAHMRSYYSQFGLGVNTLVDFPRESTGYKGILNNDGLVMELAIGQFDSYTPIEISQYVNTIANGGYRVKPRLVSEALNHDTKEVAYQNNVEILNTLENDMAIDRIRQGMRACVTSNNCGRLINASVPVAAKTGTAQVYDAKHKVDVVNSNLIAFAPYENPEISVVCLAPSAYVEGSTTIPNVCRDLTAEVIEYYMQNR